jgi:ketosteroid isomerase-like protein
MSALQDIERKMTMSEQNVAVVQQVYNNFKAGNIQALLDMLPDNITWHLPEIEGVPFAGKRTGRDAVRDFFVGVEANQETLEFEPREYIAQGDKVVSLGHYRWRVKTTGREFSSDFAHVFTIRDGKITGFQEYTDTASAARAYQKSAAA